MTTTGHSRKSQRVYRSPSDPNEPSPYSKMIKKEQQTDTTKLMMDIDAKDEEAGTILMALAQNANRIRNHPFNNTCHDNDDEKPIKSNSMSIRNLLDSDVSHVIAHVPIYHEFSTRRNSSKKGFQICLEPRRNSLIVDDGYYKSSFRHPNLVGIPTMHHKSNMKFKGNTTHVHISYRIHAHRVATAAAASFRLYETHTPYPSAFRAPSQLHHYYHSSPFYHYNTV